MINNGRPYVIDQVVIEPGRFAIYYHEAIDDIEAGGKPKVVASAYLKYALPGNFRDELEEFQEDAHGLLDAVIKFERRLQREGQREEED